MNRLAILSGKVEVFLARSQIIIIPSLCVGIAVSGVANFLGRIRSTNNIAEPLSWSVDDNLNNVFKVVSHLSNRRSFILRL